MSRPAGMYACGCGGAHPLGVECPTRRAADPPDPYDHGFSTPADVDDETRALLAEAAAILPGGVQEYDDLRRRLYAHLDVLNALGGGSIV